MAAKSYNGPAVLVSRNWQLALIIISTLSLLFSIENMIQLSFLHGGYVSKGTWLFQASTWAFPVLSAGLGLAYAMFRYKLWLHRIFWAVLLALINSLILSIVSLIEGQMETRWHWYYSGTSSSYWLAFRTEWLTMLACLLVYGLLLLWLARPRRRR